MDEWVSTSYAPRLSGRQNSNTRPELALRKALWRSGLRYRLHPALGERMRADLLLVPSRICVFVDGCYWHQCPRHKPAPQGGPNADLWRRKFARTKERDRRADALARGLGWVPVRVWECSVVRDADAVAGELGALALGR